MSRPRLSLHPHTSSPGPLEPPQPKKTKKSTRGAGVHAVQSPHPARFYRVVGAFRPAGALGRGGCSLPSSLVHYSSILPSPWTLVAAPLPPFYVRTCWFGPPVRERAGMIAGAPRLAGSSSVGAWLCSVTSGSIDRPATMLCSVFKHYRGNECVSMNCSSHSFFEFHVSVEKIVASVTICIWSKLNNGYVHATTSLFFH